MGPDRPARLGRLREGIDRLGGRPPVRAVRRIIDRFNAAGGGLLAAGLAYNAVLALVPIAVLSTGLAGFILQDPLSQTRFIDAVITVMPPLRGVIDEIVVGIAESSPSLSIIGLVLAGWGTSRLFASLDAAVEQFFVGMPPRTFVSRTLRRFASIAVMAAIVVVSLVLIPVLSVFGETVRASGPLEGAALSLVLIGMTLGLATLVLGAIYREMPPAPPPWSAIGWPAIAIAAGLLVLTRLFVLLAPRLLGANVVYGTLGAIFVAFVWLNLVFSLVLIGAAWVRERTTIEPAVPSRD